jgi:nucleoid-associated protein YgaU
MSQLTDKYGDVYILAQSLGTANLEAREEEGKMVIRGTAPTRFAADQIWDKVKSIDPNLSHGDLSMDLAVARQDIYGEYEVKSGDTLSAIARDVTRGKLTYQQVFEANRDILNDPDKIHPGQKLKIPNF